MFSNSDCLLFHDLIIAMNKLHVEKKLWSWRDSITLAILCKLMSPEVFFFHSAVHTVNMSMPHCSLGVCSFSGRKRSTIMEDFIFLVPQAYMQYGKKQGRAVSDVSQERQGSCSDQGPIGMHFSRNTVSMRCKEISNRRPSSHEGSAASALSKSTKERCR